MTCGEDMHGLKKSPTEDQKWTKQSTLRRIWLYPNDLKMLISASTFEEIYPLLLKCAEPDSDFISSS
jgi:hypothetical protein